VTASEWEKELLLAGEGNEWAAPLLAKWADTVADLSICERERDAYKKAKEQNDERYMTERDEARFEVKALREELADYRAYYENAVYEGSDWELLDRIESRRSRG